MARSRTAVLLRFVSLLVGAFPAFAYAQGDAAAPESLGDLIAGVYQYGIEIVGLCVFLMFLYAGYLYMFGDGGRGRQVIQNAVIGAILLFSAVAILNTINPDFVQQDTEVPVIPDRGR